MTETNTWVRIWGAAPQSPDTAVAAPEPIEDATLRQEVRVSGGGRRLRVRFTNEYGTGPLTIGAARVNDRPLTFGGRAGAVVPAGAPILSDPVDLPVAPLERLVIGLYVPGRVDTPTCHGRPVQAAWITPTGAPAATPLPGLALVSAVEVLGGGTAVVALGDSLTDGFGAAPDADRSWPDRLAERLGGPVVNQGICGNRLLNDGLGASGLARFDRDVLGTPGLGHVIVALGSNDLAVAHAEGEEEFRRQFPGEPVTADDVIAGYRQLIARAHTHGVRIHAATLTPFEGMELWTPAGERARQDVNAWIRGGGEFDAVHDFDAVWRDPAHPTRVSDGLHAGDHGHGSDAGYRALADSVDLSLFHAPRNGKEPAHA
jgi:lysophospholipase L1-like esterase